MDEPLIAERITALVDSSRDQFQNPEPTLENVRALQGVIDRVSILLNQVPPTGDYLARGGASPEVKS